MKDLTSLVNSLPPLTKGADNWIRNLVTLTAGDPLCLGDYRGLFTRQGGAHVCDAIMAAAGLTDANDRQSLVGCAGPLHDAMRALYPVQLDPQALCAMTLKEGEDLSSYLDRASKLWMEAMGTRHATSDTTIILWRRQVVGGLPETVQQNLEDVLNLDTSNQTGDAQWHIVSPNIGNGKKLRPTRTGLSPDSYSRPSWQR